MKKKSFIIIGIFLALVLTIAPTKERVFAQNLAPEHVAVIGTGEVCVNPTIAEIRFMIVCKENSIAETINCSNEKLQNIVNAISEVDADISENISTEISSIQPIFDLGSQMFEKRDCIKVKTKNIENVNEILSILVSNGALFRGEICYGVEDYESEYAKALESAKQNAIQKASILGKNLKLERICEDFYSYSCCYSSANNCITIQARVKAIFENDEGEIEQQTESELENNSFYEKNEENIDSEMLIDEDEKDIA